jgi:F1F0 ATPase subunit 2
MNEIYYLIFIFTIGIALGFVFFGGLWYTVKKALVSKMPALWFFISFILRISIILSGFYFIASGTWQRLFLCLLGFTAARFIVIYLTKLYGEKTNTINKDKLS